MTGEDGVRSHLFYDPVGSLRLVVNGQGNVVKEIQYDAFGSVLSDSNPGLAIPLGFAGGLHDPDTGLVRFGFRDYDPATGRWTAKDPIGFAGGDTDLYGYCLNDPVNFTDPEGLSPAGWVIRLTRTGFQKISSLSSTAAACLARRQGENVLAPNRQAAKAVELGAFGGAEDVLRHKRHDLANGGKGMPHFQTPGKYGHTFWCGVLGFLGSLLDPFDAISGELANVEADMDGNGIPDYLRNADNPCLRF